MAGRPHVTEHRSGDRKDSDYRSQRSLSTVVVKRLDGHTRWIIAVGTTTILALASLGAKRFMDDTASALAMSNANSAAISVMQAQQSITAANQAMMAATLQRIEERQVKQGEDIAAVKARLRPTPRPEVEP